jgi:hypothetical protein
MTRWSRLKCFSSHCGASSAGGGLKTAEWVPGEYLDYEEELDPQREPPTFVDLPEAEASIAGHLRKDGNVALAVTPGVGKTRAGIMEAARGAEKGVIVYALPNHRLIGECMKRAEGLLHKRIPIMEFWGRRPTHPLTCLTYDEVKKATSMGYSPAHTVCPECPYGPKLTKESLADRCLYYRQLEELRKMRKGFVFCTTASLPTLTGGVWGV